MCGAVLDGGKTEASASSEETSATKSAGRVRQQTVAVSEQDLKVAKDVFKGSEQPTKKNPIAAKTTSTASSKYSPPPPESEIPAYQEEFINEDDDDFAEDAEDLNFDSNQAEVSETAVDIQDNTDFGDPLGAFIEEVPVEESVSSPIQAAPVNELNGNGFHEEAVSDDDMDPFSAEIPETKISPPVAPKRSEQKASASSAEQRTRVVIESGARKQGLQKNGLSFGKGRSESVPPKPVISEDPRTLPEVPARHEARVLESEHKNDIPPAVSQAKLKEETVKAFEHTEEITEVKPMVKHEPKNSGPKPVEASSKGRLYGWLVSYSDPRGIANELRDGKFFVGRSSLKGSDLILDDDSISTPHALMGVNVNDGLMVQDLMSDRGVFVRRRAGEAYQRVLESTKLEHGDWVRFGDIEFLVAIIAVPPGR